jgi:hypothetical protein
MFYGLSCSALGISQQVEPRLPQTVRLVPRTNPGDQLLIGASAIRNSSKAPKINGIDFSNRHKTSRWPQTPISAPFLPPAAPAGRRVPRGNRGDQPLIGASAIRNPHKALKIRNITFSNRHKIPQVPVLAPLSASQFCWIGSTPRKLSGAPCLTGARQARISFAQSIQPEGVL